MASADGYVRLQKNTKIVCTLGPASSDPEILKQMILHGANVFRLNFSHGNADEKQKLIESIRNISRQLSVSIAILADLQGPKFRLGELEDHKPFTIKRGEKISLKSGEVQKLGNRQAISTGTPHAHTLLKLLEVNHRVLINDGAIVLKILKRVSDSEVACEVVVGGEINEKKGINVPDIRVPMSALTEKDRIDALLALENDIEWIALSFVQQPQDLRDLREFLLPHLKPGKFLPKIMPKIEKPQAFDHIDEILAESDGCMVARGDLGVECSFEKVPAYQKMLIRKCNELGKPVITATQMLESMIHSPTPTRAEASDVFNAVIDGTDAVMLSAESAAGEYPVEAVSAMATIVREAEEVQTRQLSTVKDSKRDFAIAKSAVAAASSGIDASALVVLCVQYELAIYISKLRPTCPVIVVTFNSKLAAQIELCFGCHSLLLPEPNASTTSDQLLVDIEHAIEANKWLNKDDQYVFVCAEAPLPAMRFTLQLSKVGAHGSKSSSSSKWTDLIKQLHVKKPASLPIEPSSR